MPDTLGVAIVGTGTIANQHARSLVNHAPARMVSVFDVLVGQDDSRGRQPGVGSGEGGQPGEPVRTVGEHLQWHLSSLSRRRRGPPRAPGRRPGRGGGRGAGGGQAPRVQ